MNITSVGVHTSCPIINNSHTLVYLELYNTLIKVHLKVISSEKLSLIFPKNHGYLWDPTTFSLEKSLLACGVHSQTILLENKDYVLLTSVGPQILRCSRDSINVGWIMSGDWDINTMNNGSLSPLHTLTSSSARFRTWKIWKQRCHFGACLLSHDSLTHPSVTCHHNHCSPTP